MTSLQFRGNFSIFPRRIIARREDAGYNPRMETKRLALVYSGQPRNLKECWKTHFSTLGLGNPDWDMDIFAHFWYDESWTRNTDWNRLGYGRTELASLPAKEAQRIAEKRKNMDATKITGAMDSDIKKYIDAKWKPKGICFETPRAFDYRDMGLVGGRDPFSANNALSMFYSMEEANKLKCEYERKHGFKYDCVVRLRTDLVFLESMKPLVEYDLKQIAVRDDGLESPYFDDILAFGNSDAMDKFCSVFGNLRICAAPNLGNPLCPQNAEDILNPHEVICHNAKIMHELRVEKRQIPVVLHRYRHYGQHLTDAPLNRGLPLRIRMNAIKTRLGENAGGALADAARLEAGLDPGAVSLADFYALFRVYDELIPDGHFLRRFKPSIRANIRSLRYRRGERVPARYLWHYYRYKLKSLLRGKNRN